MEGIDDITCSWPVGSETRLGFEGVGARKKAKVKAKRQSKWTEQACLTCGSRLPYIPKKANL